MTRTDVRPTARPNPHAVPGGHPCDAPHASPRCSRRSPWPPATLLAAAPAANAAANPGPGFPAQYAAPYVETWGSPAALANARNATGLKYFTLAFVISDGSCNATLNGNTAITDSRLAVGDQQPAGGRR